MLRESTAKARHKLKEIPDKRSAFEVRFGLGRLMAAVTVFCLWLATLRVDIELFVGLGVLACLVMGSVFRYRYPAKSKLIAWSELWAVAFFLAVGCGLVIRFFTSAG